MGKNTAWGPAALMATIGPGILVAATGVGAGDLATASFTGNKLGLAILWAVVVGALLKFVLNEGLARWQLATGETLLEGAVHRLGGVVRWVFLSYLLLWSFFVGTALMAACGATMHAMWPIFGDPSTGKIYFGILHGLLGLVLVWVGGFVLFEKVMSICIAVMFVVVLWTAGMVCEDWSAVLHGLVVPSVPHAGGAGLGWTVALIGGVGGTLTVLCYGYWMREKGRFGERYLRTCRIDLAVAYASTALFGLAMVIIGSTIEVDGRGAGLIVNLAESLRAPMGAAGRWVFLIGAWGAVFSSLLGVWQAVPYIFADFIGLTRARAPGEAVAVNTKGWAYRGYLLALALVPCLGLMGDFRGIQKVYAVFGALFMPMLALALLLLNGRTAWIGKLRNRPATMLVLLATLALFLWFGYRQLRQSFGF